VIASLGPLSPVTAFILGWIFLGQNMTPLSMLGFVLVLASIVGVQRAMMGARKATLSHTK
ncbi:MAG: EamA family transporter, partial [Rothia dentocariosa]